jgi:hypothetical protein
VRFYGEHGFGNGSPEPDGDFYGFERLRYGFSFEHDEFDYF